MPLRSHKWERFVVGKIYKNSAVPYFSMGKIKRKGTVIKLIKKYQKKMHMKFKRIWWGPIPVKIYCDAVNLREHCSNEAQLRLFSEPYHIEQQSGILRNLDSVTRMDVIVKC